MRREKEKQVKDHARIARKITIILFLSQSLSSAGFIAAFAVNALVGVDLSGRAPMAGVPGTVSVLGQACGALLRGFSMDRIGRRGGLAPGQVIGVVGSVIAMGAVVGRSLPLFLTGLVLVGIARPSAATG
ncbi:MAG: MFS transporter [Syntrophales bacterium]